MAVSKRTRFEVLRRDNYTCRYCRSTENQLTVDHVTPVALGGTDDPSNLVAACRDCNAGKASSSPDAETVARVSDDAMRYGACAGLHLIGWDYPSKGSLKDLIDREKLYPLTCLTTLSEHEKKMLLEQNLVLCSDLLRRDDLLRRIHISEGRIPGILDECRNLCRR